MDAAKRLVRRPLESQKGIDDDQQDFYWTQRGITAHEGSRRKTRWFYGPFVLIPDKYTHYMDPGVLHVPQSISSMSRTNPFAASMSYRPLPLRYIGINDQNTADTNKHNSNSPAHSFPSEALKNLYRLVEQVYVRHGDKHIHVNTTINGSHLESRQRERAAESRPHSTFNTTLNVGWPSTPGGESSRGSASYSQHAPSIRQPYAPRTESNNGDAMSDSVSSLYTMGASTLIGEDGGQHAAELDDIKSTIHKFAASVEAWTRPLDSSAERNGYHSTPKNASSELDSSHFNPIIVRKDDGPWKHQLLHVLNAYRDAVESNTALHSDMSKLREDVESARTQVDQLRNDLYVSSVKHSEALSDLYSRQEALHAQNEQLAREVAIECRAKEVAEARLAEQQALVESLRTQLHHLETNVHYTVRHEEKIEARESALQARYDNLAESIIIALREQMAEVPVWLQELRSDIQNEFAGLHSAQKHQREELAQLTERTSRVAIAQENLIASSQKDSPLLENVQTGHQEVMSALGTTTSCLQSVQSNVRTVESKVDHAVSSLNQLDAIMTNLKALESAVQNVAGLNDTLPRLIGTKASESTSVVTSSITALEPKLDLHTVALRRELENVQSMLNERTEKTLHNQAQITSTLSENVSRLHTLQDSVHALGDKLQRHISSSADIAYANISVPKKSSDDEEEHSSATAAAIDALRVVCTSSLERIKDTVEKQNHDVQRLVSQASAQDDRQISSLKATTEALLTRLNQVDDSLRHHGEHGRSEIKALLTRLEGTIATLATLSAVEQTLEDTKQSHKDDFRDVIQVVNHVSAQIDKLSTRQSNETSTSFSDISAQLSDINSRLVDIESTVQGVATTAEIVEEIATIRTSQSHEHQASTASVARVQTVVESLEEYTKSALDQVNVALDEQQSRLVSIQTHCRQHSEDFKAISSTISTNTDTLQHVSSHMDRVSRLDEFMSAQEAVSTKLEDVRAMLVALQESEGARIQTLQDASSQSTGELRKALEMLEQQAQLLQSLSQQVHDDSGKKDDLAVTHKAEVVALLTALLSTVEITSKETTSLREVVTTMNSELSSKETNTTEKSEASSTAFVSISESLTSLRTEILNLREQLVELTTSFKDDSQSSQEHVGSLLATLAPRFEAILSELSSAKEDLSKDIVVTREGSAQSSDAILARVQNLRDSLKAPREPDLDLLAIRAMVEKQESGLLSMQSQIADVHSRSFEDAKEEIAQIRVLLEQMTIKDVQESIKELGITINDIKALVSNESTSATTSITLLSEVRDSLQAYSASLTQITEARAGDGEKHLGLVELLDRNHSQVVEVRGSLERNHSQLVGIIENSKAAYASQLEEVLTNFKSSWASNSDTLQQSITLLQTLQTNVAQYQERDATSAADVTNQLASLSQILSDLRVNVEFNSTNSQTVLANISKWESSQTSFNATVDQQYSQVLEVLNTGITSLRAGITDGPSQLNALLVEIQTHISSLQQSLEVRQQSWEQTLRSEISVLRQEIAPLNTAVGKLADSQSHTREVEKVTIHEQGHADALGSEINRMEKLRVSIEGLVSGHHCNGCNCKGYDSTMPSPYRQKGTLSTMGSDAAGLSPQPYSEQTFDVPSPSALKRDFSEGSPSTPAKPYSIDLASPDDHHGVRSSSGDGGGVDKIEELTFPRPKSPGSSVGGSRRGSIGSARHTSHQSVTIEHSHHEHSHREVSNPFELFSRRRKTSHVEEGQESTDRPRVKSSTSTPGRTSIGHGKSQRVSLLGSALLSTVSDNTVPQVSRSRTTSGGLHRLSSIFGKHHHHHHDEETTKDASKEASTSGEGGKLQEPTVKKGAEIIEEQPEDAKKE
ncbi:related to kinesin, putative-Leishmania major [Serendipita indica DSM 11827]|uniref:Related to kinesin, putative-Leishmania major n=1 Tax=Serendipita indica (strain DSM 11827) TaxID=1109443 RepID=G4T5Q8_SERID|nr:related to kinesin, putative-Leishmania major [Serendipita indica DSM 11827]